MNVVKRGKVFYLIDRYIEERQVQTLLLLVRGGNLEVRQLLKDYIDKWGAAPATAKSEWPRKVADPNPALFIGLTGIDEEFKDREVNRALYNNRLNQLANETLYEVMTDFGGEGQPFTNVFPIRYPGTWDADEARRRAIRQPGQMGGGGQDLRAIGAWSASTSATRRRSGRSPCATATAASRSSAAASSQCTTALQKQDLLPGADPQGAAGPPQPGRRLVLQSRRQRRPRSRGWPPAKKVRGVAGRRAAGLRPGRTPCRTPCASRRATPWRSPSSPRVARASRGPSSGLWRHASPSSSRAFLNRWARELATARWREYVAANEGGRPWLPAEDFGKFTRFLCDYLCREDVFDDLSGRLLDVVGLAVRDRGRPPARPARICPRPAERLRAEPGRRGAARTLRPAADGRDFGLMDSFVRRWQSLLPAALAAAAGAQVQIPPGNDALAVAPRIRLLIPNPQRHRLHVQAISFLSRVLHQHRHADRLLSVAARACSIRPRRSVRLAALPLPGGRRRHQAGYLQWQIRGRSCSWPSTPRWAPTRPRWATSPRPPRWAANSRQT